MTQDLVARAVAYPRGHARYPPTLEDLRDPPKFVRVVGALTDAPSVAVVGTRRADPEALDFALELGRCAASRGVTVVSGGALGVDAASHRGALEAEGRTVAVLPTGFGEPYPREHRALFNDIAQAGALLTEAEEEWQPTGFSFLRRNRLIAALADVMVVVQAPARSGALSTAKHAVQLGRPLFAVPAAPWEAQSAGGLRLLQRGARICARPDDVLSLLASGELFSGVPRAEKPRNTKNINTLTQEERQIVSALARRARHVDEVCQMTGIPALQLQRSILRLLIDGWVEERPGGRYKSCQPTEAA